MSYQAIPMHLSIDLKSIQNYALYIYFFSMVFESFNLFGLGSISFFSGIFYVLALSPSINNLININKNIYFL